MPFNFANPFDDPFANQFQRAPAQPQADPLTPLSSQEEEGLLSKLGRHALGGLGYIGGSLDKALGGRAIRGVLGGRPEELASLIPFSDALGITNEDNAVTGKQLLGYDQNDDSWGGFLGGTAAEMLLDPGTYAGFGAKTALGKLTEKAKLLPKGGAKSTAKSAGILSELNPFKPARFEGQLATEMKGLGKGTPEAANAAAKLNLPLSAIEDQPLASLVNLNVPFGEHMGLPGISLGTGKGSQRVANMASGLKDAALYSSAGRAVSPLFDSRLSEFGAPARSEAVQRGVRSEVDQLRETQKAIRVKHVGERNVMEGAGIDVLDPAASADINQSLRQFSEGLPVSGTALPPTVEQMAKGWGKELKASSKDKRLVGRRDPRFEDDVIDKYFPRQRTQVVEDSPLADASRRPAMNPINPNDIRRKDPLRNVEEGTIGVNALFEDPLTKAIPDNRKSLKRAQRRVEEQYLGYGPAEKAQHGQLLQDFAAGNLPKEIPDPINPAQMIPNPDYELMLKFDKKIPQARELVQMSSSAINKQYRATVAAHSASPNAQAQHAQQVWAALKGEGVAPFQNSLLGDISSYRQADAKSNAAANAFFGPVLSSTTRVGGEGTVPLQDVLKAGGYWNKNARKRVQRELGVKNKDMRSLFVPEAVAKDMMTRGTSAFDVPDALKPVLSAADSVTNLTKAWQTKFYPSTILRNLFGESFANLVGKTSTNPLADIRDVARSRAGKGIESLADVPAFRGLSPDDALRKMDELSFIHGVDRFDRSGYDELVGKSAVETGNAGTLQPIGKRGNLIDDARQAGSDIVSGAKQIKGMGLGALNPMNWVRNAGSDNPLNPLAMAGVGGRTETKNAAALLGEKSMSAADEYGRKAAFFGLLKQGFDPEVAARKALELGMDPSRLAPFEKQVMRRLIPYYGWSRHNLPQMLGSLMEEPGGLVGQSIRGTNNMRQQEGIVPDYAGEGALIPLGSRGEDGTQRYLTGLGLPFEDLKNVASSGPHAIQRTGQKLAAQLNPLIRNPIEMLTGLQFYSGRDTADLYARSGSPTLDPLLGMTPLQRPLNVASTLADPRKGILGAATNLLSPARITDIDMNRAAQTQGRRLVEEELRMNPLVRSFENVYVPAAQRAQMAPEDLDLLRYYQMLQQRARQNQAAAVR